MNDQNKMTNPVAGSRSGPERATVGATITKFRGLQSTVTDDVLAVEEPLELQLLHGPVTGRAVKSISVTMRTPGHDFELAAGFLMTEGIVKDAAEIDEIVYASATVTERERHAFSGEGSEERLILPYQPERNVVRVSLAPEVTVSVANLERNFYTTSSCGICGKASLLALRSVCPPRAPNTLQVSARTIHDLPDRLRNAQDVFDRTGGLHAAGLFDDEGNLLATREDVGRHNAADKLLGAEFLADRTPLRNRVLLLSGRASFELLQKSLMAGIAMVVSVGAPSSLAVQVAKEFDITLAGFVRSDRFNVYHGAERIIAVPAGADTRPLPNS